MNSISHTLTSMEVAEMVEKDHRKLLRDIRTYTEQLGETNFGLSDFWKESTYITSQNKEQPCYLVTKKGCEFIAHKLTGTKGAAFTARYIERFHEMEETLDRSKLSPQMQMFYALADSQASIELEQRKQAKQIETMEKRVDTMKEIFTAPIGDWKNEINRRVREIAEKSNEEYQNVWNKLYGELETTAHCSLKRLCENKEQRMIKAGNTKTAIKEGTTKLAVIYDKPQLKAIFEGIVKRYAMAFCA